MSTEMSDQSTEPGAEPGVEPTGPEPTGTAATEQPEQPEPDDGREAARYRRRLREAETQRDAVLSRLDALQRAEVVRLAAETLADGSDLWLSGDVQLADLLDDEGNVDPVKVTEAAGKVLADRPHWTRRAPAAAPAGTVTGGDKIGTDEPPAKSWAEVLSRQLRTG